MARARKPAAPKPAPEKPARDPSERSFSWRVARVDLPCGHSVTRTPGLKAEDVDCEVCRFNREPRRW